MGLQRLSRGLPPGGAEAAVAVIRVKSTEFHYLVLRRALNPRDPWSGHFAFPGGRREPGDPDLLAACRRETREECGIPLPPDTLRSPLPLLRAGNALGRPLGVAPYLFELPDFPAVTLDPVECAGYYWVPESRLRHPDAREFITPLPDARRFPAIRLDGGHVWGFTYKVLADLLGLDSPRA